MKYRICKIKKDGRVVECAGSKREFSKRQVTEEFQQRVPHNQKAIIDADGHVFKTGYIIVADGDDDCSRW